MQADTDEKKIDELLSRGVEEVIPKDELRRDLLSGRVPRVQLGIEPTSKLFLLWGDFTVVIGDTSDKDSERPMLSREVIEENKKTYFEQAGKILDLSRAEVR